MSVYEYRAADGSGQVLSGLLTADNPRSARDRLRADGLRVHALSEQQAARQSGSLAWASWGGGAVRWAEAAHELAILLSGGVPLLTALDTVAAQSAPAFRRTLLAVRDQVAAGTSLAQALAQHPHVFDDLSVRLVEVGENVGNLDEALDRLSTFKRRWHGLRDQVTSALIYPVFVLTFGAAATLFLMTYVMPPLLENLRETLDRLPWPTMVVKTGSDLLLEHGLFVILGMSGSAIVIGAVLRSPPGRRFVDRRLLKLPLFGPLATKQSLSRVCLILSTLLESGLPLADALDLAARSVGNRILREALEDCREALTAGRDLARSLSETGVIPPLAVQIFAVGQESGKLEELLARLADDYDRQVQAATGRLAAVLEPVLILILAAMIGFVLLAIVLPILEAGNVAL